jgi:hypothetical protein
MWFETADGNLGWIGAGGTATFALGGLSGNALALYSNSTRRMFFDTSGHVGIGTSTPAYTLDVAGTGRFTGAVNFGTPVTFASGQTFPIPAGGVTNAMLANSSLTVTAGSGLSGGGSISLGGTTTLSLNPNVSGSTAAFSGSTSPVVSGTNTSSGSFGQLAATNGTTGDTGVYGNGSTFGVVGFSSAGPGVYGTSNSSSGVLGLSMASGGYAVLGQSSGSQGYGILGTGEQAGVRGENNFYESYGQLGTYVTVDESPTGVYGNGGSYAASYGVYGTSSNYIGVYGIGPTYGVYSNGPLGSEAYTGSDVALADNRVVELYAMQSPENWFEDFGSGQLHDGVAGVALDPTFALAVNPEAGYHVFLTPNGDCEGLYVAQKTATGFQVRELRGGKSNIAFDYRVVAKRRGYEDLRMAQLETDAETVQRIREVVQSRPAHRKLILHKPPEAPKAPPALPKVGTRPAAPAVVMPKPLEPPKLPAPPALPKVGAAPAASPVVTPKPPEPAKQSAAPEPPQG